jgi:hypothetical protein
MFELFILLVSNTDNLLVFNVINNNCDFDIIRIKKEHIMCNDLGIYKKYCNSRYQPEEFIIYNEKTVNKKQITIKPYNLIISTNYYKKEIAKYYYYFTCNNADNYPRLIQHIIPNARYDVSLIYDLLIILVILIILIVLLVYLNIINYFWIGYLFGIISITIQNYYII